MTSAMSNYDHLMLLRDTWRNTDHNRVPALLVDEILDAADKALKDMRATIEMLKAELATYLGREVIYILPGMTPDQELAKGRAEGTIVRSTAGADEWVLSHGEWVTSDDAFWAAESAP